MSLLHRSCTVVLFAALLGWSSASGCSSDDTEPPAGGAGGMGAAGGSAAAGGQGATAGGGSGGGEEGGSSNCGLRVFPGAEGFGTDTRAAYGDPAQDPVVIKVVNLDASGPGSLDEALRDERPRVIVFEVSGTIETSATLVVRHPYAIVAGHTAPSPGITIRGGSFRVPAHDVLIQHLRVRVGDDPNGPDPESRDALSIGNPDTPAHHVVVDHCSLSWAVDEITDTWYESHDNTFSNTIFSECLANSLHPKGEHSKGPLIGASSHRTSLIRNVMMSNTNRNPRIACGQVAAVNNFIYNPGNNFFEFDALTSGSETRCNETLLTCVGNVGIPGPSTNVNLTHLVRTGTANAGTRVYFEDNITPGVDYRNDTTFDTIVTTPPVPIDCVTQLPSSNVEAHTTLHAGARPSDRDAVDNRLMSEIASRAGLIIDSQDDAGGWPTLAENTRELTPPANPHADDDGDGYTNLENWLHCFLEDVEARSIPGCN